MVGVHSLTLTLLSPCCDRELTPLAKLRLFDELHHVLLSPDSRKAFAASFERAALKAAEGGGEEEGEELDGERLPVHLVVRFLQRK